MTILETLERLHKAATPEPWLKNGGGIQKPKNQNVIQGTLKNGDIQGLAWTVGLHSPVDTANAALIVAMRNALPKLLRVVRLLEEEDSECFCASLSVDGEVSTLSPLCFHCRAHAALSDLNETGAE